MNHADEYGNSHALPIMRSLYKDMLYLVSQMVKTFSAFYETRRLITVFTQSATGRNPERDKYNPF
jgi:hypothetical protein